MDIQSSLSEAQIYATNLQSGSSTLSGIVQAQEDGLTTVSGNTNAHDSLQTGQTTRQELTQAISDMVTNIHSVAGEFEAVDQQVANTIAAKES